MIDLGYYDGFKDDFKDKILGYDLKFLSLQL